jgi:hypothetical protein
MTFQIDCLIDWFNRKFITFSSGSISPTNLPDDPTNSEPYRPIRTFPNPGYRRLDFLWFAIMTLSIWSFALILSYVSFFSKSPIPNHRNFITNNTLSQHYHSFHSSVSPQNPSQYPSPIIDFLIRDHFSLHFSLSTLLSLPLFLIDQKAPMFTAAGTSRDLRRVRLERATPYGFQFREYVHP